MFFTSAFLFPRVYKGMALFCNSIHKDFIREEMKREWYAFTEKGDYIWPI
jgi:hypothetical protein